MQFPCDVNGVVICPWKQGLSGTNTSADGVGFLPSLQSVLILKWQLKIYKQILQIYILSALRVHFFFF